MPDILEAKCFEFAVQILHPPPTALGAPMGGEISPPPPVYGLELHFIKD